MASSIMSSSSNVEEEQPISRTYQYRKVMKPMLERKRRARINRCLDELKELMSSALASEGENLTKLEKADVLELTVRHLHKLRERQALGLHPASAAVNNNNNNNGGNSNSTQDKFRAGFTHCAAEVSRYLATSTGLDVSVGQHLLSHLGRCVHQLEAFPSSGSAATTQLLPSASYTPPSSPTQQQQQHLTSSMGTGQDMRSPSAAAQLHHHLQQQRSLHLLPPLPVSPVSSPALSDIGTESGPCDYSSKYSIRSDLYSPASMLAAAAAAAAAAATGEKVWRPW